MTKYKQYFLQMVEENKDAFSAFKELHNQYVMDPQIWQFMFNIEGKKIVEIVRVWERKLCAYSERGQYGIYSSNLAEKFWNEVRLCFPKIDFVGVKE